MPPFLASPIPSSEANQLRPSPRRRPPPSPLGVLHYLRLLSLVLLLSRIGPVQALDCDPGQYCLVQVFTCECTFCRGGSYCEGGTCSFIGGASATPCPAGRYNPSVGSTSSDACLPCGAGEGSSVGSSVCTPCTPGTFSQGGEDCSQCPAGQYSDDAGAASCPFCGAGKGSAEGSYA